MSRIDDVKKLARKEGAKYILTCPDWNGKKVYQLLFNEPDEMQEIGIPTLVTLGWSGPKILSDKEAMEYQRSGSGDEDFEPQITKVEEA